MECSLNECGVCGSESVAAFCENCNFRICETCFHMHKRSTKLFENHVAFLIETTKLTLDANIAGDDAPELSKQNSGEVHTSKCATHTTENVIFFCSDHSDTLCGRCVVSCHKLCKIVDLFEVNIDDEEVTACKSHLRDLAEKIKCAAHKIDQNTTDNLTCKQECMKELQQLRIDVNTWFHCLQSKCEKQFNETFETNTERLTRVRKFCNELGKRIEDHQELIESLLTQNHVKQLYVLLNKVQQEIVEINSKLTWLDTESSFTEYNFKRSSGIQKLLNDKKFDIGGLEESCSGSDEISEGPLSSITSPHESLAEFEKEQVQWFEERNRPLQEIADRDSLLGKADVHLSKDIDKLRAELQTAYQQRLEREINSSRQKLEAKYSKANNSEQKEKLQLEKQLREVNSEVGKLKAGLTKEKEKYAEEFSPEELKKKCVICMDDLCNPKKLKCGHIFCGECIDQSLRFKPCCFTCGHVCGKITGDQPPGTMTVKQIHGSCTGYETVGKIRIRYEFFDGFQLERHPSPGEWYKGIGRTAYLPDNEQGRNICRMLKVAFERKLVFTIRDSHTTGQDGVITWNDIHHKTDYWPYSQFGYPDPTYLDRVTDDLKAKGVTLDDINPTDNLEGIITTD